ncbi:MAG: ABC transporter permease [Chloroflexi bacterium]|nr:ABC transporter permease [Chloroflexota bacterium]
MSSTTSSLAAPVAPRALDRWQTRENALMRALRLARRKPLGAVAFVMIAVVVLAAIFADLIAPYDPLQMFGNVVMQPPSQRFIMGTDNFGRDLFSRIIHGSRISLGVGIAAVLISMAMGVFLGMVSAYFEGRVDMIIQRLMDTALAFPGIIFAMAILAALGLWRHILPNVTAPIIIIAATELGAAILLEATLSFLGVGVPPPQPTWGGMLSGPSRTYMLIAPWMAIFPGLAIMLAVLGWNLLGDALRDIWDPRLRTQ